MDESSDEDDDVILVTPLDECIIHKPTESKYDVLSGIMPFKTNVGTPTV